MREITLQTTVSEIVSIVPHTSDLFRQLRIDFCCGGKISLAEAAQMRQLDSEQVLASVLDIAEKSEGNAEVEPTSYSPKKLIEHIESKHHAYLREEFQQLTPYVTKVARVHGERHPHLLRIQEIYSNLKHDLLEHTDEEEQIVFPLINKYVDNPSEANRFNLLPYLTDLEQDHENAGDLLKELREITNDFEPPFDACGTYRLVYSRLAMLEKDTFEHIYLENHVLFDNVRKMVLS
ncbi:iron-sulfur cluster repair di-iron protein [Bacillus tianshenii]|nr:iron-sulfur cluster repair di-iron protein [Bacillus tianshenii]